MTDSHTHLYGEEFSEGGVPAVERALAAGVNRMILPCIDPTSVGPMLALHTRFPENTSIALALHPTEVREDWRERLEEIRRGFGDAALCAIGETGIDLYWDRTYRGQQKEAFAFHLELAREMSLPVIIHCREALDDTLEVIETHGSRHGALPPLIFHSFTGSPDDVERIRRTADAWFGINGVVTFKNAGSLREAVGVIGLDRLLVETDSPYLAPVPKRGKRNESAFLPYILHKVAELCGVPPVEAERVTDANAAKLFK